MAAKKLFAAALFFCFALLAPRVALAHAVLVASTPAANAEVHGPNLAIELRFNSRVDGARSRLFLVMPGGQSQALPMEKQSTATTLGAHIMLKPGSYRIRWQALSTDGHITRGEIPFTVR